MDLTNIDTSILRLIVNAAAIELTGQPLISDRENKTLSGYYKIELEELVPEYKENTTSWVMTVMTKELKNIVKLSMETCQSTTSTLTGEMLQGFIDNKKGATS